MDERGDEEQRGSKKDGKEKDGCGQEWERKVRQRV